MATSRIRYKKHVYSGPRKNLKRVRSGLKTYHGEGATRKGVWRTDDKPKTKRKIEIKTYSRRPKCPIPIPQEDLIDDSSDDCLLSEEVLEQHHITQAKKIVLTRADVPSIDIPPVRQDQESVEDAGELEKNECNHGQNTTASKRKRLINPRYAEDDAAPRPVDPFERFLEDCDYFLSKDLSKFIREQTNPRYRKKKLKTNIEGDIKPNVGHCAMSSSTDELAPNISKVDTPKPTLVPLTPIGTTKDSFPPAQIPTPTAFSGFHSALILEIEKHPCLYDHLNPAYNNLLIKGHIWVEIAKTIGLHETTCQSEWTNIHNAYVNSFNNPSIPYIGPDVRFLDRYINNQEKETFIAPLDEKAEDPLECEIKTERDDEEDEQSGAYVTAIGFTSNNKKIVINLNNTDVTTERAPKIDSLVGHFKNHHEKVAKPEAFSILHKVQQEKRNNVKENYSSQFLSFINNLADEENN